MNKQLLVEYYELCEGGYCPDLLTEEDKGYMREGGMVVTGKLQQADKENGNGRIYPRKILEREVENYQKIIKENRALGECVDDQTEIFTSDGWKFIKNIEENEEIFTLNEKNNNFEKQKINKKIELDFKGDLYHIYNKNSIDMALTPNHNMLLQNRKGKLFSIFTKNFVESFKENIDDICHSSVKRGNQIWLGEDKDIIKLGNTELDSEYFMAFLGIWLAEGWTNKASKCSQICQVKENITNEIKDMLNFLNVQYSFYIDKKGKTVFTINNKDIFNFLNPLGKSYEKYIPQEIKNLSPRLLNILFDWMLKGDGRNRKRKLKQDETTARLHRELYTTSNRLANDVSELIFKLGSSATINKRSQKDRIIEGREIKAQNSRDLYIVSEGTAGNAYLDKRFLKIDKLPYDGKVYCVNVDNGTWLMRRNGKIAWTKNCDHPDESVVNLKNVSHLVTKIWWDGDSIMGKLKILPTPSGNIIKSLVQSGVKLGISSRGLGSTKKEGNKTIVEDDFQLICFDFVQEPSTPNAFMMSESKKRAIGANFSKLERLNSILDSIVKK